MTELNTSRFRFFLPDARVLDVKEIANLPPEKLSSVETMGSGLWLEISCPDDSCFDSSGNITIPARGTAASQKKGKFLNLFCPEDSCEILQSTDLP